MEADSRISSWPPPGSPFPGYSSSSALPPTTPRRPASAPASCARASETNPRENGTIPAEIAPNLTKPLRLSFDSDSMDCLLHGLANLVIIRKFYRVYSHRGHGDCSQLEL